MSRLLMCAVLTTGNWSVGVDEWMLMNRLLMCGVLMSGMLMNCVLMSGLLMSGVLMSECWWIGYWWAVVETLGGNNCGIIDGIDLSGKVHVCSGMLPTPLYGWYWLQSSGKPLATWTRSLIFCTVWMQPKCWRMLSIIRLTYATSLVWHVREIGLPTGSESWTSNHAPCTCSATRYGRVTRSHLSIKPHDRWECLRPIMCCHWSNNPCDRWECLTTLTRCDWFYV